MKYRRLGCTELQTSVIGVGTWQFGGEWGKEFEQPEVDAILDAASETGINLIDTAECYGDHLSESLIGNYLSRRNRSDWIIATKFGHVYHSFMDRSWRCGVEDVRKQLDDSLRALHIESIDIYQFHSGSDEAFVNQELWDFLSNQKKAGKIRFLGVSITSKGSSLQTLKAHRYDASVLQVVYNRLERKPETDVFPVAAQHDLGILARVPLASGLLSGKYPLSTQFSPGDVRSTFDQEKITKALHEVASIRDTEIPTGVPMAQWALAWCLKHPQVSAVIPGCKNADQVRQNASAADLIH